MTTPRVTEIPLQVDRDPFVDGPAGGPIRDVQGTLERRVEQVRDVMRASSGRHRAWRTGPSPRL